MNLLPEAPGPYYGGAGEHEADTYIYENLLPLEARILKGDQQSLNLAIRLFTIVGGAFSEDLDIILGKAIRPYPKQFLTALATASYKPELLGLLGNCGEEFVDRQVARCKELTKRKAAIQRVHSLELQKVKLRCIDELSQQVKKECKAF